jgi:hypothetical protein
VSGSLPVRVFHP